MNIYVGNLAYGVTAEELKLAFSAFGEVSNVNIVTDRNTGQSKGFAFVEMPKDSEAEEAINKLNETPINGRKVRVNQARPKEERNDRRSR